MVVKRLTKKSDSRRKLNDRSYQHKICLWIALGDSTPEIIKKLQKHFNITMSRQNIDDTYRYAKKWQSIIAKFRDKYLDDISDIPIAHKVCRLNRLERIYQKAYDGEISGYAKDGKPIHEVKLQTALNALSQAREEVEVKPTKQQAVQQEKKQKPIDHENLDHLSRDELSELFKARAIRFYHP